jgi:hypothetical protein
VIVSARDEAQFTASACVGRKVSILIPVFNDWESITILLPELDSAIGSAAMSGSVFLIDDASTMALPDGLREPGYKNSSCITIIHLRCNMGYQRTRAVGLARLKCMGSERDAIVIMCRYPDCAGLAASSANARFLKQSLPTKDQILLGDRFLIPISRYADPVLWYACGNSVLAEWRIGAQ